MSPLDETWRLAPSMPGYLASSWGRLMRVPYEAPMPHGGVRQYGGEPTHGAWDDDTNRFVVMRDGKTQRVARVVCEAFNGPSPFDRAVVMHLDENSRNNRPTNLQWGTQKENLNAPGFIAHCQSRTGANNPLVKGRAAKERIAA